MRRLLLDTHALVWWLSDTEKLSSQSVSAISDSRNEVFVSAITGWEIAYKRERKKITAPENLDGLIEERGFTHLPLTFHHAECAARLPMYHRDPFDRFLIAQAQADGLTMVTRDNRIPQYGIHILPA